MYSNTYNSIIIPIFVLIQFCNINFLFKCHHPFIFIFVGICSIFLVLVQILFCQFLGSDNRYKAEIFNIHLYFNKLSNDISHFVVP